MNDDLYNSKIFLDRLNQARRNAGMTRDDVAKHFKLHKTGVGKWFNKKCPANRVPTLAKLFKVELDYLLSGQSLKGIRDSTGNNTDRDIHITVYDVGLSAGGGSNMPEYVETKNTVVFDANWLATNNLKQKNLFITKVRGDSMTERLNDGDSVMIDKSQTNIIDGKIYAIIVGGDAKIKRLKRLFDMSVEIISDNDMYKIEIIPADELDYLHIIGRVVHFSGLL